MNVESRFRSHKCQGCERIYGCECKKERDGKNAPYDCGKCVHRSEVIVDPQRGLLPSHTKHVRGFSGNRDTP